MCMRNMATENSLRRMTCKQRKIPAQFPLRNLLWEFALAKFIRLFKKLFDKQISLIYNI